MGVSLPSTAQGYFQLRGNTSQLANGKPTQYSQFVVDKAGDFNFKLDDTMTNVRIVDQNNKVVAQARTGTDATDTHARLGPGVYTAIIQQQQATAMDRPFTLEVSTHQNALVTAGGGVLQGTAHVPVGNDPGVQKHSLNVAQGGTFALSFSMPNSRWAIMDKDGKVVGSGDTMNPDSGDFFKEPTATLSPGQYDVVIVPPGNIGADTPFRLTMVPKTAQAPDQQTELSPIEKTLQERDARLKEWASETPITPALGGGTTDTLGSTSLFA